MTKNSEERSVNTNEIEDEIKDSSSQSGGGNTTNPKEGEGAEPDKKSDGQSEPDKKSEVMSQEEKSKLAAFDRIYAERKEFKEELEKIKKQKSTFPPEDDINRIVEVTTALEGLDEEERREVILRAKAKGVSLKEAREDENFLLWQEARRKKVEEEKTKLEPSTKTSPSEKTLDDVKPADLSKMSSEERDEFLKKAGWINDRRERKW